MADEEIISHCLDRMAHLKELHQRKAKFSTVIALCYPSRSKSSVDYNIFVGELDGKILLSADPIRIKGFPMESLFWVDEWNALSGHVMDLSPDEKQKRNIYSHREKALLKVNTFLKDILKRC